MPIDPAEHFAKSEDCIACHSQLSTSAGHDVSIGFGWRASMMANAARDPYWQAAVRREVTDHPAAQSAIEDKCSTCHMPMARFAAAEQGDTGRVFDNARSIADTADFAMDGVSCTVCHQISASNFGSEESFTGGFEIADAGDGTRRIVGPHDVDAGRQRLMQSASDFLPAAGNHLAQSELCATCHTLYTHALDENGQEIAELAEQVPYLEWLASDFRTTQSCQDCHMPELEEDVAISSVLGEPRPALSQHAIRGSNAFMLGILNRNRGELGVIALPSELEAGINRTKSYLAEHAARMRIEAADLAADTLQFEVVVDSLAGHKLPTAYPSRRVWLHVQVLDADRSVIFESGAIESNGSIRGNDNDASADRYEPHYDLIETADQVQIYEPIMVDQNGAVTTGLLRGVRYIKDNRILPLGFDKNGVEHDVAVFGRALEDEDFTAGSDRVRFELPGMGEAVEVRVELLYQSIGYRWAENLAAYDSFETNRFTRYYEQAAANAAEVLVRTSVSLTD